MVLQKKIAEAVALKYGKRPSGTVAWQPLQLQGCVSMKLKQFIQQETILTAAAVLAVVSAFFVPPDAQYLGYIDLRTLAILFSLMTVYLSAITPACATVTSMAQLYDRDASHSSAIYVLSTLLSILTMPLMIGAFELLL